MQGFFVYHATDAEGRMWAETLQLFSNSSNCMLKFVALVTEDERKRSHAFLELKNEKMCNMYIVTYDPTTKLRSVLSNEHPRDWLQKTLEDLPNICSNTNCTHVLQNLMPQTIDLIKTIVTTPKSEKQPICGTDKPQKTISQAEKCDDNDLIYSESVIPESKMRNSNLHKKVNIAEAIQSAEARETNTNTRSTLGRITDE